MNKILITTLTLLSVQFFFAQNPEEKQIHTVLNNWHKAAADANFSEYFGYMAPNAVFIGTDATENWDLQSFKAFSKPYFDRGKAWSFTCIERNIYIDETAKIAWFDELLDTQMEICRGSGVLKKINGKWKIVHYVLSIAIPNEFVKEIVALKKEKDSVLKSSIVKKQKK